MSTLASSPPSSSSTSYTDQVAATTFKRLHPAAYLRRFLDAGIREDARRLSRSRPLALSLGPISTAHGSAFVKLQNSVCIAAVKAEVAVPSLQRPDEGYLVPNIELPALSSSRFKPGPPGDDSQVLTSRLFTFLTSSSLLDPTSLCIHTGSSAWCLHLDITFLSYDGNPLDAAVLAAVAALRDVTLPAAQYSAETRETRELQGGESERLKLNRLPLCASFGVFEGTHLLADPSAFESSLVTSHLTIGFLSSPSSPSLPASADICYLYQSGGLRAGAQSHRQTLHTCVQLARERCTELATVLDQAEKETAEARQPQP